jgi:hypothetical protein
MFRSWVLNKIFEPKKATSCNRRTMPPVPKKDMKKVDAIGLAYFFEIARMLVPKLA